MQFKINRISLSKVIKDLVIEQIINDILCDHHKLSYQHIKDKIELLLDISTDLSESTLTRHIKEELIGAAANNILDGYEIEYIKACIYSLKSYHLDNVLSL